MLSVITVAVTNRELRDRLAACNAKIGEYRKVLIRFL